MSISHIFCNFAFDMAFPFQIDILNIMVKGIIIGALASAPMGPVGILCVQRTLNKGRWYGLTWLIDKIREKFDTGGILIINKVIGSTVIVLSIVILIGTIFNLYTFY